MRDGPHCRRMPPVLIAGSLQRGSTSGALLPQALAKGCGFRVKAEALTLLAFESLKNATVFLSRQAKGLPSQEPAIACAQLRSAASRGRRHVV